MAKLNLTTPPPLAGAHYQAYKSWLEEIFFDRICAYCLSFNSSITIDHYIPQSFDPSKINDPLNLLLSCHDCQNSSRKWDYHHLHSTHMRHKKIPASYAVHDIRFENIEHLFEYDSKTGAITAKNGPFKKRANFLISLFTLDLDNDGRNNERQLLIDILDKVEFVLNNQNNPTASKFIETSLPSYMTKIARNEVWLHCLGIPIPRLVMHELQSGKYKRSTAI